jgi:hypothetical protein
MHKLSMLLAVFVGSFIINLHGGVVFAGTVTAGDEDILRLDLFGGLANPSPGVMGGGSILWTKYSADAFGVSAGYSRHELVTQNSKLAQIYLDLVWEHSIALWDGYYALRLRGSMGGARSHREMDRNVAVERGDTSSQTSFGAHIASSIALDLPVADLMWGRIGIDIQRNFSPGNPTIMTVLGGLCWGGQWLGVGD